MKVHKIKPSRTFTDSYNNYRRYKEPLRNDFNKRCGYCDDDDDYCGGKRAYHIDHFKPKSKPKFVDLECDYLNLVYSCPYCNIAKSDKWRNIDGFIDPCNKEYDKHLKRSKDGNITPITTRGEYIAEELKLYLIRHKLLWNLRILKKQQAILRDNINTCADTTRNKLLEEFFSTTNMITDYSDAFSETM